jgi:glutathione S-transferase
MAGIVLFGAAYSVYVRAVRLALEEKGLAYRLEEIDIFDPESVPADYAARHPFGKIPALEHDGFRLYESGAILRYIDERFPEPPLMPLDIQTRARANQLMAVLDNYAYRTLVWEVYVPSREGDEVDKATVVTALPTAERCLGALEALAGEGPFLLGGTPTLPDLLAYPMLTLFGLAPEGAPLLPGYPRLDAAHAAMAARPSAAATRFPVEEEGA